MADRSTIEWTDATWNPLAAFDRVTGRRGWFCVKVSEGCRNCYAESFNKFRGNGYEYTAQNRSSISRSAGTGRAESSLIQ
jgi:protein gp37